MDARGKTDGGRRRQHNEDMIFVSNEPIGVLPNLYIVADGMGGHRGGAVASQLAIEAFCAYIEDHKSIKIKTEEELLVFLKRGINHANHTIFKKSESNHEYKGMGTTMTLCTVGSKCAYIAHVGDTRFYTLNQSGIEQITIDHSLVQEMLDKGYISKEDVQEHPQRHVITRAVGTYEQVKVDTLKQPLNGVEYIVLCSDGLTTMLSNEVIQKVIYESDDVECAIDQLIHCANEQGGIDNIAVIIAKQSEVNT